MTTKHRTSVDVRKLLTDAGFPTGPKAFERCVAAVEIAIAGLDERLARKTSALEAVCKRYGVVGVRVSGPQETPVREIDHFCGDVRAALAHHMCPNPGGL